jgi:hypothetical protein
MNRTNFLVLLTALLLSACGSGGSGFIEPPVITPPPVGGGDALVISPANSKSAAKAAFGSTMQSVDMGGTVGGGGIAATPNGTLQKIQIERSMTRLASKAAVRIALGPDIQPCLTDGTVTISGDLATGLPFSVGDTINVDAMDCDDGLGEVVNGRMEITVTAYSGDILFGPTYVLGMSVMLIDYEIATATDTIVSNGDSTVTVDTTGTPLIAMSITGLSLTTASLTSTDTVTGFSTAQTVDISVVGSEPYTLAASGTINSTLLGGEIVYSTPVTFQGAGAGYPFAGEMLVTGANGATVRLIALDDINVRIETDADGDGQVDVGGTENTTWVDIDS